MVVVTCINCNLGFMKRVKKPFCNRNYNYGQFDSNSYRSWIKRYVSLHHSSCVELHHCSSLYHNPLSLIGLSCAKWLRDSGINDVIVLEARGRVGGRTFTKQDPSVNWVDLGGAYVGPTQDYILRQIKDLGLKTYKVNEDGQQVFYHKVSRPTCV